MYNNDTYNFHVFFCTCLTIYPYKGVTFTADRECSQTRNCHSQIIALLVMKQSFVQCFNFKNGYNDYDPYLHIVEAHIYKPSSWPAN